MTSEERFWELVNREIDRELTPPEQAELENCLNNHPQWGIRRDELVKLTELMSGSEEADVPPDMKEKILRALPDRRPRRSGVMVFRSRISGLQSRFNLRYAYAFAGGIMVGAGLLAMVMRTGPALFPTDNGNLTGAIVLDSQSEKSVRLNLVTIDREGASGNIDVAVSERLVKMRLVIDSDRPVELTVEFEPDAMVVVGFDRSGSDNKPVSVDEHNIRLLHTGTGRYDFTWSRHLPDSTTILVKLATDERQIYDHKLVIPPQGT